jgi:hypothetical protein
MDLQQINSLLNGLVIGAVVLIAFVIVAQLIAYRPR